MTTNILVIAEENHPLHATLNLHFKTRTPQDALLSSKDYDFIFDLTALRTKAKTTYLRELSKIYKGNIISDLSLSWIEKIKKECPNLSGAISLLFFSPTDAIEFTSFNDEAQKATLVFLETIGKKGIESKNSETTFHYPRTVSMIINEAYFALDDKLADSKAIDLAMKNGVNYPLGPIEWGKKIGEKYIIELLKELHEITEDPRYRLSKSLKLQE